jgi:LDH2 family malate/lactate/ureidoglycolate dehydrogenase
MIGFSSTNAPAAMAPTGGCTAMLGTNPLCIAIPAGREMPVVLDMATTVVARGRIMLYAKQNKPLEPGWAFDDRGVPTTDPHAALKGLLAPIGGYKGYGIALAIDFLCGVLTGSNYGTHFPGFLADNMIEPTDVGSVFAAVNVESFMDLTEFTSAMDKAIQEVKVSQRADGVKRIYLPGEIEFEMKAERLANGIPIPEPVVKDFRALGRELDLPFPQD